MIIYFSKVLIVGGGDGGVIREVVKHPQVEEVILCEIDQVKFYY
jgi:spermidine synthase